MYLRTLFLGLALLCCTAALYRTTAAVFSRVGLSLVRTDPHTGLPGMVAEFTASVILSMSLSAAMAFLFVGLMGVLGVPVYLP